MHGRGNHRPDLLHRRQLLKRRSTQSVDRGEPGGQQGGDAAPHMPNAEGIEQPGQAPATAGLDLPDQTAGRFFRHPFQRDQIGGREPIEIGIVADKTNGHQLLHQFVAEALDIHRIA